MMHISEIEAAKCRAGLSQEVHHNNVGIIIIGVNEWERYTLPMLDSIRSNDTGLDIILVDNGSAPAYPESTIRLDKTVSYAEALNTGLLAAGQRDWYIVSNNDVLINKAISPRVVDLRQGLLYGFWTHDFAGRPYLSGWCLMISKYVLRTVGYFDAELKPMWFEDADYSIRADAAGVLLCQLDRDDWGVKHLEDERMPERKSYIHENIVARKRNRDYVRGKHGL